MLKTSDIPKTNDVGIPDHLKLSTYEYLKEVINMGGRVVKIVENSDGTITISRTI